MVLLLLIDSGVDAESALTVGMTPKAKRVYTDANKPQSAVGRQRSVKIHAKEMSKIKKDKGGISKTRLIKFYRH